MVKKAWLIDFNGMLTNLGLFYTYRLGNHIHCSYIFCETSIY